MGDSAGRVRPVVHVEREEDIAVVVIDNPPINAASLEVRSGLMRTIEEASADPEVHGVVLLGAGSTFVAGSDLREFGEPLAEPLLPQVIADIERCEKPVIAALHGAALGGGFELAMGCDARIALHGTVVGLPEVTLGVIPGAGGTQRLPRLAGIAQAITMICSGERVRAEAARSLGLIDAVVTTELRGNAIALARSFRGSKRRVRDMAVPVEEESKIAQAAANGLRTGKNRPAVWAAIAAVMSSMEVSFDEALAQERAEFQTLRESREARALRYLFFAERDAAKHPELDGAAARPVDKIAVVGAGMMGAGIVIAALDAGFRVALFESDATALDRGVRRIADYYDGRVKSGRCKADEAAERRARLQAGLNESLIGEAELVIEAVFEDIAVKQEVFRRLDRVARPGAVLATNTSYLDIDQIAAATSRAGDVAGLHFFSPANVMRLLEVVRGRATSPDVVATCLGIARRLHKVAIVSGNTFGFIGNRIYGAYRRQCEFMLEEGASPQQVDAALEDFGFAMGPFAVADLSGLDIAWKMRQSLAGTRDPMARYVRIPDMLCEAGRLGRKSGSGYYGYEMDGTRVPDPAVDRIIEEARRAKVVVPRSLSKDEITRRAVLAMVNEAALLLADRVAQRASDVDLVMVNGYGFPKWEGGPVFWARERDVQKLDDDLDWLRKLSGHGFVRCDTRHLFR